MSIKIQCTDERFNSKIFSDYFQKNLKDMQNENLKGLQDYTRNNYPNIDKNKKELEDLPKFERPKPIKGVSSQDIDNIMNQIDNFYKNKKVRTK